MYVTEQENSWAGSFGNDYIERNKDDTLTISKIALFAKALSAARGIKSCIEFGTNMGINLKALQSLFPNWKYYGIEINANAVTKRAEIIPKSNIHHCSILDFCHPQMCDLVLISGVLIHINPDHLPEVYDKLVAASSQYLLVVEYYNPTPVVFSYRGHADRLFKRDFAGEIMDRHPNMQLLDYGFAYHRDPNFPLDDANWFLMEKKGK